VSAGTPDAAKILTHGSAEARECTSAMARKDHGSLARHAADRAREIWRQPEIDRAI